MPGNNFLCVDNLYTGTKENIADGLALRVALRVRAPRHHVSVLCEVDEIHNLACPASPIQCRF
ncbi:MAG: SDR family NAD-dependent epimerase/dehydratase, partial [Gammaproteobacteria bacterium]|nr:SDR family NAD-dependent epimerase/dehydratase [Gammaproteobacteria bacterium]